MVRPRSDNPTPGELEILKILWESGEATVREVMELLNQDGRSRAYTSVMSLLNVMTEKGHLKRRARGRAFVYRAALPRSSALNQMVSDLWNRAFEGSASTLVAHLLDETNPTSRELREIRKVIESYEEGSERKKR